MAREDYKSKMVDGVLVDLSDAEIDACVAAENAWEAGASERAVKQKILELEVEITPRRIREAILGTDSEWLKNKEAEIATERSKL